MRVTGLTIDPFTNMPIVILKDAEDKIALPIWIGLIEASAIATELEKVELSRPMTHDLMKELLGELNATVEKIEITDLTDNTFFAHIHCRHEDRTFVLDSRPSDALAMALRTNAPIFVERKVIEKSRKLASIQHPDEKMKSEKWTEILENLTAEDFGKYKM
jgi:bifunctional DNase/RNase